MQRGRKAGSGKDGPFIEYGRVLRERRETMPSLEASERSQSGFAKRLGVSQSFLGQVERGVTNISRYDLGWFERNAPHYGWTTDEMLVALGIQIIRGVRVMPAASSASPREERIVRFGKVPYIDHQASSAVLPRLPAGEAWLEDDGFLGKHPNGYYFRIGDPGMEPNFPEYWFAAIVPDAALAFARTPVLVWLSSGTRVVRYLVQPSETGEFVLYQPNPPLGERRLIFTPKGSSILGVVVDVKREIHPNRVPRLSSREIAAVLEEEMPELLETVDL